ncbi:nucleotidyltransferase family protein [Alteromonas sp. H39]|uniref:nucleotidyltransferase domain-containing protein n=1 Tax=Alteromonas sp. H39 TaxID=3389876 RepID=UPI0039E1E5FD
MNNQGNFEQFIAILINPTLGKSFSLAQWRDAILFFRHAKLLATLYYRIVECDVDLYQSLPEKVRRHLYSAWVYAARQKLQTDYEVRQLTTLLNASDVKPIFLKGAAYAAEGLNASNGRVMSDLDILVARDQLAEAEKAFVDDHWQVKPLSDYDEKYYREFAHEIPPLFNPITETTVDLHHNLYLPISGRAPKIELFLARTRETATDITVFEAEAMVLHSCIHLILNEDFSGALRDLFDIHLLCEEFDSAEFHTSLFELAKSAGLLLELYYCLALRAHVFKHRSPLLSKLEALSVTKKLTTRFTLVLLKQAIVPAHFTTETWKRRLSRFAIYIRGHYLKMPLRRLSVHFLIKAYVGIFKRSAH